MRILPFPLFAAVACFLTTLAHAGDLDAPGAKPVTVRSEVERGKVAVQKAANEVALDRDRTWKLGSKVDELLATNQQARTDSDGFRIGLHFAAWQAFWTLLSRGEATDGSTVPGHVDLAPSMADAGAKFHYLSFRKACGQDNLTAEQLRELFIEEHYDPARDDAAWETAAKAGKYAGTKLEKQASRSVK